MAVHLVARLLAHTTLRWSLFLLSAVTFIYLVIYFMRDGHYPNEYPHFHAGHPHSFNKFSKGGYMQPSFIDDKENPTHDAKGVWLKGRHIRVISAIHDLHHPNTSGIRIVLLSFLQHSSQRKFVCCFHQSVTSRDYQEVPARLDFIDLRFIVDIQNAAFDCLLKSSDVSGDNQFKYVSLAPHSCQGDVSLPLRIVYPVPRSYEFAVCTKIAYARLEPTRLVEWFEYMRGIGASKVVTFHNNLHPDSKRVFDFYASSGFLELIEYQPQITINGTQVLFVEENSQTYQARQDKTMVVRDCQYRLGGYDFVITIDFDELPVPVRPYRTLNSILQNLLRSHMNAAAFRMDPLLMPPEWKNPVHDLFHWQFSSGTHIAPYCVKWAYIPGRTLLATTHEIIPKQGYETYVISQSILHFLHFRSCKSEWHLQCSNLTPSVKNEDALKRFRRNVLLNMRKLPLESLLHDKEYIRLVHADSKLEANKEQQDKDGDDDDDDEFVNLLHKEPR